MTFDKKIINSDNGSCTIYMINQNIVSQHTYEEVFDTFFNSQSCEEEYEEEYIEEDMYKEVSEYVFENFTDKDDVIELDKVINFIIDVETDGLSEAMKK